MREREMDDTSVLYVFNTWNDILYTIRMHTYIINHHTYITYDSYIF